MSQYLIFTKTDFIPARVNIEPVGIAQVQSFFKQNKYQRFTYNM